VGSARTALFSWLYARHRGGRFVLRIEDTDRKRSTEEAIGIAVDSLRWLGLDWDEGPEFGGEYGPYRQTERMPLYARVARKFVQEGQAYYCYCTPTELEDRRREALKRGETPGYDGRCRNLTDEDRAAFDAEGRPKAIRFAMSGSDITVHDLIRGDAHFPASDLRDFVIIRSDGTPTYLLAAAVDDVEMHMTHVIRGEDLLPSTPRQLEIMRALGAEPPAYAHLPLIVGPNQEKLSKRHGAVSVEWFREEGYLPEALVNYLALLGWSLDDHTTFFTRDELITQFDLSRVSHNAAAFDREKLRWMNGHYIREADDERLADLLTEALRREGLDPDLVTVRAVIPLIKERMHTIREGVEYVRFLFVDEVEPDTKAAKLLGPDRADYLKEVASRLEGLDEWRHQEIDRLLRAIQEEHGLSSRQAFMPIRAAITGSTVSPPLFESMELLGRERTLEWIRKAAGALD
jgi:glutamyl-tRNA synthetase